MKPMESNEQRETQTAEQRETQTAFLNARARYRAAETECATNRLSAWQLQLARDEYIAAIEAFAQACGVLSEQDLTAL